MDNVSAVTAMMNAAGPLICLFWHRYCVRTVVVLPGFGRGVKFPAAKLTAGSTVVGSVSCRYWDLSSG